jgi:hypothetical protein
MEVMCLRNVGQLIDPPLPSLTFFEVFTLRVAEFFQGVLRCEDQPPQVTGNTAKEVVDGVTLLPEMLLEMLLDEGAGMDICVVIPAIQRGAK